MQGLELQGGFIKGSAASGVQGCGFVFSTTGFSEASGPSSVVPLLTRLSDSYRIPQP